MYNMANIAMIHCAMSNLKRPPEREFAKPKCIPKLTKSPIDTSDFKQPVNGYQKKQRNRKRSKRR